MESFLGNLSPLNTVVSRKIISFSDISAVNLMVGWNLLTCSINRSKSFFIIVQLDNREHYKPKTPIVKNTQDKVHEIIDQMHRGKHIDDMTKNWLQTPNPPRIPIFYTLTKNP